MRVFRSAFSLVELAIVLAVLVALTGLVAPALVNRIAGARLESVRPQIEAAGARCRSEAQRRGELIRLVARGSAADGAELWLEAPASERAEWLLTLPEGMSVRTASPGGGGPSQREGEAAGSEVDVVIAAFLPDGSALPHVGAAIEAGGRRIDVRAMPWSGRVRAVEAVAEVLEDGTEAAVGEVAMEVMETDR